MSDKRWLGLPFLGASHDPEKKIAKGEQGKPVDDKGNGLDPEPTHESTLEDFANKTEEDIVQDYNSPIHMWVVATLFPLIAGTFGPMASMFNVCAIAISWRVIVNPDSKEASGQRIPDPDWLVGVNIMSLITAILANLSLLGQMTNRLRYNISGPITIVGFFVSGVVDIALVGAASSHSLPLPPTPHATYSQAFYYAAFSGAIYVLLAIMLSVTAYGIWFGQYSNEFKLSMSQRSLMLQTSLFLTYVLCSGAIYAAIEDWSYLDATYFVVVTLFTIGFGDLTPTTHLGRSLFFPFSIGGILFVGVIIANIRTLVLESGSVKVSSRLVELARHKAIRTGKPEEGILKLGGVRKRDKNADTELKRREKEFNAMREIQQLASRNHRLFSLAFATVAFMILWFIGAVAFWKAESESIGGQNWSYFEALYFTFVAQITVGYGDFEPQTNSAKPAFVLWSLIALPTLTVLIGAIGDVVADFVNWYTDWIGSNSMNIYQMIKALGAKKDKVRKVKEAVNASKEKASSANSEESAGFEDIANIERQRTVPLDFKTDGLSAMQAAVAGEIYKPLIALKAVRHIMEQHLDATPPKKYSFKEWAWLLKLLGEDETDEAGHRRVGQPLAAGQEVITPTRNQDHQVWSWLGQESPLMSLEQDSEPKWVLKKLLASLEQELEQRVERHIERHIGSEYTRKDVQHLEKDSGQVENVGQTQEDLDHNKRDFALESDEKTEPGSSSGS